MALRRVTDMKRCAAWQGCVTLRSEHVLAASVCIGCIACPALAAHAIPDLRSTRSSDDQQLQRGQPPPVRLLTTWVGWFKSGSSQPLPARYCIL